MISTRAKTFSKLARVRGRFADYGGSDAVVVGNEGRDRAKP
ncbi:MAG: hypothetical protein SW833_06980 [Cyanobacteriota bacterium]|nr:hypothetical protein [Cyanobacteriota bacterium]